MAVGKVTFTLFIVSLWLISDLFRSFTSMFFIYDYILPFPSDDSGTQKLLIIGVMSAQQNFKERESIRNTWGKLIDPNLMELKFIIGSKICPIPPSYRITPYVCEKWSVSVPQSVNLSTANIISSSRKLSESYIGFSFIVKHNISLIRLGIHSQVLERLEELNKARVILLNSASGDKVATATLLREDYNGDPKFIWKGVQIIKLLKGFEGELKLISNTNISITCVPNTDNNSVIYIFELMKDNFFTRFKKPSCLLVAFSYILENEEQLNNFIKEEDIKKTYWENEIQILEHQLEIESRAYNDILFFDLIDVYNNLSWKLFEFLKWTQMTTGGYKFILKTDDDVFLDLNLISSVLMLYSDIDWDWWSCFRPWCTPPNYGKWRDRLYSNTFYPPFPSGAGYVLINRVASLIVSENNSVQDVTSGEDVAVGLWVHKSLGRIPKVLNTSLTYWACGTVCSPIRPCNVPELNWQQLHEIMHKFVLSKSIC